MHTAYAVLPVRFAFERGASSEALGTARRLTAARFTLARQT
jgi:hypothetical protein